MFNLFGGPFSSAINMDSAWNQTGLTWLKQVVQILDNLIIPFTIVVAIAGAIWIIILGVKLARAETADKAKEAKGALIRVAIAIVASLILIWLLTWFASNLPAILDQNPLSSVEGGATD